MNRICIVASTFAVAALCTAGPALARDQIKIVGSSTVFPYTQAVAEQFSPKPARRRRWSNRPAPAAA